ncbi:MAG: hypothetical protein CVT92_07955 [Bacteroidetes bacterium HGW-Bacteroidetes-1]|jgi:GNAT superfamily N-acetyltransferase|nr:MAG: hypothetical protein CVT92_07955 [Bacteroidetes bacterium HGW-Bacteroidetes-1]
MQQFQLVEVITKKQEAKWLAFPSKLYKDDPYYVRPLDQDIKKLFNKESNKLLRKGEAIRWVLLDENKNIIGRIAAFIDPYTAKNNDQPTGGCGFFDCINNQEAANTLFDASKSWLAEREMEAMDGPVNFGDRDSFWGLLVENFVEPVYNMPYNFPYYIALFENYGFKNYFNQYTFQRPIDETGLSETMYNKASRIKKDPDYTFESIEWRSKEKYALDFMTIYNKAWGVIPGVKMITQAHAMALLNQMKPILDPRLVHFGYYKNEPISFGIMMQDLNQIIKDFDGNLNWFNKLRFMYRLKYQQRCTRVIGRIFGIIPEHQGKGVDGALIMHVRNYALKKSFPYKEIQMNWIGDFNPPMMKVAENMGGKIFKIHVTYRFLFDRNKPFERAKRQEKQEKKLE